MPEKASLVISYTLKTKRAPDSLALGLEKLGARITLRSKDSLELDLPAGKLADLEKHLRAQGDLEKTAESPIKRALRLNVRLNLRPAP